jgi:hypothetical protein
MEDYLTDIIKLALQEDIKDGFIIIEATVKSGDKAKSVKALDVSLDVIE